MTNAVFHRTFGSKVIFAEDTYLRHVSTHAQSTREAPK